jgi:sn-glycerol 3-phosphate transport system permease protein
MQSKYSHRNLPWVLLFPTLIIAILFLYYPMLKVVWLSLHKVAFFGMRTKYVGLDNFVHLFTSAKYLQSFLVSILYAGCVVALGISLSVGFALLLNAQLRGSKFYRILFIWPYALSPAVAGAIWLFIFNPTAGIANYILNAALGIKPEWLSHGHLALTLVIMTSVWKSLGYNILFLLAALQGVPKELLEAAEIDGANAVGKFWNITLPMISPTLFFLLIMNSIKAFFMDFGLINVMTEGGPGDATNILIYDMYTNGFRYFKSGYASAQSLVLFAIVLLLTLLQFRTTGRKVHYGGA